ncbi:MAG TPA: peptidoglycan-binding protein [Clostridiales bacterium]|nr:peptidoglycan-binding protein [Clostridiales bacterium]
MPEPNTTQAAAAVPGGNPAVRELQTLLDQLARHDPRLLRLTPDGRFGERTLEAVMRFQRDYGLPVTGTVDLTTWETLVAAYRQHLLHHGLPTPLRVLPHGHFQTLPGSDSPQLQVAQALLGTLLPYIANLPAAVPGQGNVGQTQQALLLIQQLAGLPPTGALDRATWEALTRLYHTYVTRDALSGQG